MKSPRPVIYIKFGDGHTSTGGEEQERGMVILWMQVEWEALLYMYISIL